MSARGGGLVFERPRGDLFDRAHLEAERRAVTGAAALQPTRAASPSAISRVGRSTVASAPCRERVGERVGERARGHVVQDAELDCLFVRGMVVEVFRHLRVGKVRPPGHQICV